MVIYTKIGDKGSTKMLNGTQVPKNHYAIHLVGEIDELQSQIDTTLLHQDELETEDIDTISIFSDTLWQISGRISNDDISDDFIKILNEDVVTMERMIDKYNVDLKHFVRFQSPVACSLNECRVRTRSLERLIRATEIKYAYQFINRLSDYFFALAAKIAKDTGDIHDRV